MIERSGFSGPGVAPAAKQGTTRSPRPELRVASVTPPPSSCAAGLQPPLPSSPIPSSDASSAPARSGAASHAPTDPAACRRVTSRVAEDFGVALAELVAPSRGSPRAALARQVAMYLCHVGFALNFEAVGRLFSRDRTTVAHACRVVEDRRDDRRFDRRLSLLECACGLAVASDREGRA